MTFEKKAQGAIRWMPSSAFDELNRLLRESFLSASDFEVVDLNGIHYDSGAAVLAALDSAGRILAAMQIDVVPTVHAIETCMHCSVDLPEHDCPAMIVRRAFTCPSSRRLGLNTVLRHQVIQTALDVGAGVLLGAVYQGASRIGEMERLGYRFVLPRRSWQTHVVPQRPRILAILHARYFSGAVGEIRWRHAPLLDAFPVLSERPESLDDPGFALAACAAAGH